MPKDSKPNLPMTVHFKSALTVHVSERPTRACIFAYGDELEITEEIVRLNTDRFGRCALLERIDTDGTICSGPWPEGVSRLEPGSFEYAEARERAVRDAHALSDPSAKQEALHRVRQDFGSVPTSRTIATIRGDDV